MVTSQLGLPAVWRPSLSPLLLLVLTGQRQGAEGHLTLDSGAGGGAVVPAVPAGCGAARESGFIDGRYVGRILCVIEVRGLDLRRTEHKHRDHGGLISSIIQKSFVVRKSLADFCTA